MVTYPYTSQAITFKITIQLLSPGWDWIRLATDTDYSLEYIRQLERNAL